MGGAVSSLPVAAGFAASLGGLAGCSGIASAGAVEVPPEGSSSKPETEPLLELPRFNTLLALLMKRVSPGGLSPEPPAPPDGWELIVDSKTQYSQMR